MADMDGEMAVNIQQTHNIINLNTDVRPATNNT